jgi:hypothetical protein
VVRDEVVSRLLEPQTADLRGDGDAFGGVALS